MEQSRFLAAGGITRAPLPEVDVIVHVATDEGYARLPYVAVLGQADADAWLAEGWEPMDGDDA